LDRRKPLPIVLAAVLMLALYCWIRPGAAYIPPLNDLQAHSTSYSVTYHVTDPERGLRQETWVHPSAFVPGGSILIQHVTVKDGVITWIDGYQAPSESSFVYAAHSATYDPLLGVWQRVNFGGFTEIASLHTSGGVVAWSARALSPAGIRVFLNIYNPLLSSWTTDSVFYPRATDPLPALSIREENPAVTWTFGGVSQFYGFHPEDNLWNADSWTHKVPFFAAQPLSGTAPLKVYFTDLSIAAQWWSWAFGDGAGTTIERSPSHVFTRPGVYRVTQTIGNNTSSPEQSFTRTIKVSASVSGAMNLLLND
jgi:hypothetical protein